MFVNIEPRSQIIILKKFMLRYIIFISTKTNKNFLYLVFFGILWTNDYKWSIMFWIVINSSLCQSGCFEITLFIDLYKIGFGYERKFLNEGLSYSYIILYLLYHFSNWPQGLF